MKHVNQYITNVVHKRGGAQYYELLRSWPEIMGNLARRTRLESCGDGCLCIGVYDPQWMQELYMLRSVIHDQIEQHIGKNTIARIQFKLVERRSPSSLRSRVSSDTSSHRTASSQKQCPVLDHIKDTQLQNALYRFFEYSDSS